MGLITIVVALLIIAVTTVYICFSWGFVCFKFYWWFILPVFPDMPHLDLWQCMGLMFFISLFRNHTSVSYKKEEGKEWTDAINNLLAPWILLFIASFFN